MRLGSSRSARWFAVSAFWLAGACGVSHSGDPNGATGSGEAGSRPEAGQGPGDPQAGHARGGTGGRPIAGGSGGSAGRASTAGRGSAGMSSMGTPTETTFAIRNDGDAAILLGSNCGARWLDLKDHGKQLGIDNHCSCPCDDRSVCGCPAVCLNTQELLMPGTTASLTWDGVVFDYSTAPSCYVKRLPQSGDTLTATGCWNSGDNGKPENCNVVEFAYGKDTLVTIPAKAAAPASIATRVALTNTTDAPIEVVTDRCGSQAWFELDMGPQISLTTFCACRCSEDLTPRHCPVCGGCTEDVIEKLAPGQTISFDWDGGFDYRYEAGCTKRYQMPRGTQVYGKFCWSKPAQSAPMCVSIPFSIGGTSNLSAF